jgi:hypothetical protein
VSEIGDLYVLLSSRPAQMIAGFEQGAAAGEEMATAIRVSMASVTEAEVGAGRAAEELAAKTDAAAASADASGAAAGRASRGWHLMALGAAAGAAISIKAAGDFQQGTTRLVTSAGELRSNLGQISAGILQISTATNTSTKQLLQGMYYIESAGFHGAAANKVLKATAEGAQAEGADLGTMANAVTSALNAYGLGASHAVAVTNMMIAAVAHGKMTMQDLAGSIATVLPLAARAHLSFAQVAGAISTMTAQGMSAHQVTDDLRNGIKSLLQPSAVQVAEMQQLGINSNAVSKNLGKNGLTGTITMLQEAILRHMGPSGMVLMSAFNRSKAAAADADAMIRHMPPHLAELARGFLDGRTTAMQWRQELYQLPPLQRNLLMQFTATADKAHGFNDLLKSGIPAAQTYTAALSKMMGGTTGLQAALMLGGPHMPIFRGNVAAIGQAAQHTGKNVENWDLIQHNFNFQLGQAAKSAAAVGISFGTALLPAATAAMHALATGAMFLAHYSAASKALAVVIGAVLAAALEQKLVKGLRLSAEGFKDAGKGVSLLTGLFVRNTAAQEASAAASAVQAEATAGATAATEAETAAAGELDAALTANPIGIIVVAIAALVIGLVELYKHCALVRRIVADVGHFFASVWHSAMHLAGQAIQWFTGGPLQWIKQQVAVFTQFWHSHGQEIKQIWSVIWKVISTYTKVEITVIVTVIKAAWAVISAIFKVSAAIWLGIWRVAWAVMRDTTKIIWTAISGVIHLALQWITGIIGIALDLMTGKWGKAWSDAKKLVSDGLHTIVSLMKSLTADFGHLLWDAGKALIQGLIGGIKSMIGAAVSAAKSIGSSVLGAAKSIFGISSPSRVMHDIGIQVAQGLIKGLEGTASQVKSAAGKLATDIKNAITDNLISQGEGTALTRWMERDNSKLQRLASQRAAIAKQIKDAKAEVATVAGQVQDAYSLMSMAQNGPITAASAAAQLKVDVSQVRQFSANIKKLAKMGLNKKLIAQIIQAGPVDGAQIAQALAEGSTSDIKSLNSAESQLVAASTSLGKTAADSMYDHGRNAGKGFLEGLKSQEAAITAVMKRIAHSMVNTIRRELRIHSPSEVMREHGLAVAQGLALGMGDGTTGVEGAAARLAAATVPGAGGGPGGLGGGTPVINNYVTVQVPGGFIGDERKLVEKLVPAIQQVFLKENRRNPVTGNGLNRNLSTV